MLNFTVSIIFTLILSFYFLSVFQYSGYYISRVLFHFPKKKWHFYHIIIPFTFFIAFLQYFDYFLATIFIIWHILSTFSWHKKLDKQIVFTRRIWRNFIFIFIFSLIFSYIFHHFYFKYCETFIPILSLFFGILLANIYEIFIFKKFYTAAQKKLENFNCLVILITASYGKTSTKNYLSQILSKKYNVYAPKKSINTLNGILKDINENLPLCDIYIVEAGARKSKDILQITQLVNPHYCIIGQIGNAHLEYFKNIENIQKTKLRGLLSNRLKGFLLHSSTCFFENFIKDDEFANKENLANKNLDIKYYDDDIKCQNSTLDGISFSIEKNIFKTNILGEFNSQNLGACVKMARFLGLKDEQISKTLLNLIPTMHRLQKIENDGKIILDDSFNGNIKGMSESYKLCSTFNGRKIIVTPGIIEVDEATNIMLCDMINQVFDLAILTSFSNEKVFKEHIKIEKIFLKDKSKLTQILSQNTHTGDLIIFSNDAPAYV